MGFFDLFLMALVGVAAAGPGERFRVSDSFDDGEALFDDGYDDYVGDGLDGTDDYVGDGLDGTYDDDYDDYDDDDDYE